MLRLKTIASHLLKSTAKITVCRSLSTSSSMSLSTNTITSHEVELNGGRIFYETAGNGPHNLLLLPGALGSTRTDFLPQLSKLDGESSLFMPGTRQDMGRVDRLTEHGQISSSTEMLQMLLLSLNTSVSICPWK